nr:hypothetical protein [Tanacetum cinerariifolium]
MKSSTPNVESSNVEVPSHEEEVFYESFESFQEESSLTSLNDDVQQSPEEVILPQTNTQSISNNMVPNVDEASTSHNVFNERLEDAYFDAISQIEAIRLFLAYAAHKDFTVFQMDVKTSFLNGILKEKVYSFASAVPGQMTHLVASLTLDSAKSFVVVVVGGIPSIIKLSFMIIGSFSCYRSFTWPDVPIGYDGKFWNRYGDNGMIDSIEGLVFLGKSDESIEDEDKKQTCFLGGDNSSGTKKSQGLNSGNGNTGDGDKITNEVIEVGIVTLVEEQMSPWKGMDVNKDSLNKDYMSSVLESVKANSLASKINNIGDKFLPRRYTTYQEPLKDAGLSKSTISNVKDKVDTIRMPSFASVVHEKPQKTIIKIKEMRNEVNVNGAAVTIPTGAVESVNARFVNTLYGYFIGDRLAFPLVENYVKNTWANVLENGPWLIRRVPLLLNEWTANTILKKDEIKSVPIGKPLMLDSYTSNMCVNSWGRSAYARVLIEIAADVELVKSLVIAIPVGYKEEHTFSTIDIEYEWTPPRCASCRIFDHVSEKCPKLPKVDSSEKVIDDGFIEVKKKKAVTFLIFTYYTTR